MRVHFLCLLSRRMMFIYKCCKFYAAYWYNTDFFLRYCEPCKHDHVLNNNVRYYNIENAASRADVGNLTNFRQCKIVIHSIAFNVYIYFGKLADRFNSTTPFWSRREFCVSRRLFATRCSLHNTLQRLSYRHVTDAIFIHTNIYIYQYHSSATKGELDMQYFAECFWQYTKHNITIISNTY